MPPLQQDDYDNSDSTHSTFLASRGEQTEEEAERATKISFGTVEVRTFNRIVGDHPDCKVGPPITIDWDYIQHDAIELGAYESDRKPRPNLKLTSITRKNLLKNVFEIPEEEIRNAEKEVQRILKKREQTKKQTKTGQKAEQFAQSAKRKIRRAFSAERLWKGVLDSQIRFMPMAV
eukprot:CAMPEP_0116846206 /NCGR_PEP_ID=MMETSP0418-20121206/13704_1 /TAXON_ID=1158023 /ORGANISM="Astrosyne radiata, Strain 13vi08-1A" /LENGTH=175 /DNA_ID=CAMNT_0004477423 /DNA_START=42 /DNA_END=569 /DNA_ORIENTATION=+